MCTEAAFGFLGNQNSATESGHWASDTRVLYFPVHNLGFRETWRRVDFMHLLITLSHVRSRQPRNTNGILILPCSLDLDDLRVVCKLHNIMDLKHCKLSQAVMLQYIRSCRHGIVHCEDEERLCHETEDRKLTQPTSLLYSDAIELARIPLHSYIRQGLRVDVRLVQSARSMN